MAAVRKESMEAGAYFFWRRLLKEKLALFKMYLCSKVMFLPSPRLCKMPLMGLLKHVIAFSLFLSFFSSSLMHHTNAHDNEAHTTLMQI